MNSDEEKSTMKKLILELLEIPKEEREKEILVELDRISPDPAYLNYIYHSEEFVTSNGDIDVDAYIEKVFSYKPIVL